MSFVVKLYISFFLIFLFNSIFKKIKLLVSKKARKEKEVKYEKLIKFLQDQGDDYIKSYKLRNVWKFLGVLEDRKFYIEHSNIFSSLISLLVSSAWFATIMMLLPLIIIKFTADAVKGVNNIEKEFTWIFLTLYYEFEVAK
jgi:hypothetical protein